VDHDEISVRAFVKNAKGELKEHRKEKRVKMR
jgi:hypothetical protein